MVAAAQVVHEAVAVLGSAAATAGEPKEVLVVEATPVARVVAPGVASISAGRCQPSHPPV